jgi:hypothetical protein
VRPWIPALAIAVALPMAAEGLSLTQTVVPGKLPPDMGRHNGPLWTLSDTLRPLNRDRHVLVGRPAYARNTAAEDPTATGFPILDLTTKTTSVVTLTAGADDTTGSELLAYDPARGRAGLLDRRWTGDNQAITFVHWDLNANRTDWSEPIAHTTARQQFQSIGMDPAANAYYFLVEEHASRKLDHGVQGTRAVLRRFNLTERRVDWETALTLPGRQSPLIGAIDVAVSPDYRTILVKEYSEPGYGKVSPPPQAWAVDVASKAVKTLTIPMTPYGTAFDRTGRYMVIGSNVEATLTRYDLKTGKRDLIVGSLPRIHQLALSADNRSLHVFAKGREMEIRAWPSLRLMRKVPAANLVKGQQWFHPEGMAVMGDGRTIVLHQTEPPFGFPSDKALYQIAL